MKQIIIISIATLTVITGGLLIMDNVTTTNENNTVKVELINKSDDDVVPINNSVPPVTETPSVDIINNSKIDTTPTISEEEKQSYINEKYNEFCEYFFQHATMVQLYVNSNIFYSYPEKFTYELVDINLEKVKNHFIDMTQKTRYLEVVERGKSLVL